MKHESMEPWTADEDACILDGLREYSTRWTLIQKRNLPHRSISSIRNRHIRIQNGTKKPPGRNRCQRCGQIKKGHSCTRADRINAENDDVKPLEENVEEKPFEENAFVEVLEAICEKETQAGYGPAPIPTLPEIPTFSLEPKATTETFVLEDAPRCLLGESAVDDLGRFIESPRIRLY